MAPPEACSEITALKSTRFMMLGWLDAICWNNLWMINIDISTNLPKIPYIVLYKNMEPEYTDFPAPTVIELVQPTDKKFLSWVSQKKN